MSVRVVKTAVSLLPADIAWIDKRRNALGIPSRSEFLRLLIREDRERDGKKRRRRAGSGASSKRSSRSSGPRRAS